MQFGLYSNIRNQVQQFRPDMIFSQYFGTLHLKACM